MLVEFSDCRGREITGLDDITAHFQFNELNLYLDIYNIRFQFIFFTSIVL